MQLFDKLLNSLQNWKGWKGRAISINHRLRYSLTQVNYDLSKSKSVSLPEKLFGALWALQPAWENVLIYFGPLINCRRTPAPAKLKLCPDSNKLCLQSSLPKMYLVASLAHFPLILTYFTQGDRLVINTGVPLWGFSGWCDGSQKVPGMSLTYSHTLSPLELFQMQIDVKRNFCFAPQKLTLTTPFIGRL